MENINQIRQLTLRVKEYLVSLSTDPPETILDIESIERHVDRLALLVAGGGGGEPQSKKLLEVLHPDVPPEIKAYIQVNLRGCEANDFTALVETAYEVICLRKFKEEKVPLESFRVPHFREQLGDGRNTSSLQWAIDDFNERFNEYACNCVDDAS